MQELAQAIDQALTSLGLDEGDYNSISYHNLGNSRWMITFLLGGEPVGMVVEDVSG
jgi:hypothetical protein